VAEFTHHDIYQYVQLSDIQAQNPVATGIFDAVFALVTEVEKRMRSVVTTTGQLVPQDTYQYIAQSEICA